MADETATILELERQRCAAIVAGDWEAVAALVSDDVVHTHTTGIVQDKAQYLAHAQGMTWVSVERGALKVRVYDRTAVVTGPLVNTIVAGPEAKTLVIQAVATQVWEKTSGAWRQCAFHACRAPA